MDPATPTAAVKCPVDRCEYRPNVTDAALAATLLTIHAQNQHVDTSAHSRAAKVEKISRPTVDEGISLEDWLCFEQRWREYKDATRVAGSDLAYQLLDCCNPEVLRKNLVRVHRDARDYGRTSCRFTVMRWPPAANEIYWPTLRSWRCAPRMQW